MSRNSVIAGNRAGGDRQVHLHTARAIALFGLMLVASSSASLTLSDYIYTVVNWEPRVREEVHLYRQTLREHDASLAGWRPSIDFDASASAIRLEAPSTNGQSTRFSSAEANLTVTQNLFDGFETTNREKQAKARVLSAGYRVIDTADNIALEAVTAFVNVLEARRVQELAAQNVESHQRILSKIRELAADGLIRRSDVEQTEGRLARVNATLIAQQNNLEDTITRLHLLVGEYHSADELFEVSPLLAWPQDIEAHIETALRVHPALHSALANAQAALFDYERSKSTDYPTIDLQMRHRVGNDVSGPTGATEDTRLTLSMRYNFYNGGADEAERSRRASEVQFRRSFVRRVRRQIIDAIRLSWSAHRATSKQLPYLTQHVEKSLETVNLYREEFAVQKRDLIDLLDAENELNQALNAETQAHYQKLVSAFRIAEGRGELFSLLGFKAGMDNDQLVLLDIPRDHTDSVDATSDLDGDSLEDTNDYCDNSRSVVDTRGCTNSGVIQYGYKPVAQVFLASDDTFDITANVPRTITLAELTGNDIVSDTYTPYISSVTQPVHGSVTISEDGSLRYEPQLGFSGEDIFSYTLGDRRARSASAQVLLNVTAEFPDLPQTVPFYFDSGATVLTPRSLANLNAYAKELASFPSVHIDLKGFADPRGDAAANQRLSERRAKWVKGKLIELGIAPQRISTQGMGATGQAEGSQNLSKQRRVDATMTKY